MTEIVRNSIDKEIPFGIPSVTPSSVVVKRGSVELTVPVENNSVKIPYEITRYDGKFSIEWTYEVEGKEYTSIDTHEVYTPYFTKDELKAWDADFALLGDSSLDRLEVIIRSIIEAATGQNFGLEYGKVSFRGNGAQVIGLPKRLVKAERLGDASGELLEHWIRSDGDGWVLRVNTQVSWVDAMTTTNPIANPFAQRGKFNQDRNYTLEGVFGYTNIPADITLAARILAEDYGCDESLWRDRYVDNIRASDWRIEFHGKAFQGTGNVKVDQLLQKYTLSRMAIL